MPLGFGALFPVGITKVSSKFQILIKEKAYKSDHLQVRKWSLLYTMTVDLLIFQTVAKWSQKSLSVHRYHRMEQACSWLNG